MQEFKVESVTDLFEFAKPSWTYGDVEPQLTKAANGLQQWLFRGHPLSEYELTPEVFRRQDYQVESRHRAHYLLFTMHPALAVGSYR
jgi:hypothetical protein